MGRRAGARVGAWGRHGAQLALGRKYIQPLIPKFERLHDLVISCDLLLAEPDPEIFRVALQRADVRPERAAYFDGVQRLVDAVCALGIHGRVFTDAPTFRAHLAELGLAI